MNFKKCFKFLTRCNLFKKKAKDEGKRGKKNGQLETREEGEEFPMDQKIVSPQEVANETERDAVVDLVDSSVDKLQTEVQIKAEEGDNISDENSELKNISVIQKVEGEIQPTNETVATGPTEEEDKTIENVREREVVEDLVDSSFDKLQTEVQIKAEEGDNISDENSELKNIPVIQKVEGEIQPTNETVATGPTEEKVAMENMIDVGKMTSDPEEGVNDDKVEGEIEPTNGTATGLIEEKVAMENMGEAGDTTSVPEKGVGDDVDQKYDIKGRAEEKVAMENIGEAGEMASVTEEGLEDDVDQMDHIKGRSEELSEQLVVKTKENTDLLERLAEMEKQLKELKNEQQVKENESIAKYDRMAKKIDVVKTKNRMLRLKMIEMGKRLEITEGQLQETVKLSSAHMGMLSSAMENFKKNWGELNH